MRVRWKVGAIMVAVVVLVVIMTRGGGKEEGGEEEGEWRGGEKEAAKSEGERRRKEVEERRRKEKEEEERKRREEEEKRVEERRKEEEEAKRREKGAKGGGGEAPGASATKTAAQKEEEEARKEAANEEARKKEEEANKKAKATAEDAPATLEAERQGEDDEGRADVKDADGNNAARGVKEVPKNRVYWQHELRGAYDGPWEYLPLERVLLEMSDYGHKDTWKRREYLARFAAKIIERDAARPERLRPSSAHLNASLAALIPDVQPYFTYWNSGMENVKHDVVKMLSLITASSIKRMNHSHPWSRLRHIMLDDASLPYYVDFPKHVLDARSHYSNTYFSDLLRLELLTLYGGFWADATFYFAKDMPRDVYEAPFFAFKLWTEPAYSSSWFMHSYHPHNPLLLWMRHLLHEYWRSHSSHEYFDFHKMMEICIRFFPALRPYYDLMPFYSSKRAHAIHHIFQDRFDASRHAHALSQSWGFKLSYKMHKPLNFLHLLSTEADEAKKFISSRNP